MTRLDTIERRGFAQSLFRRLTGRRQIISSDRGTLSKYYRFSPSVVRYPSASKGMYSFSSTERERRHRWLPRTKKICSDPKNTGGPLKTRHFGLVQNRHLVRKSHYWRRLWAHPSASRELTASIGKDAWPGT